MTGRTRVAIHGAIATIAAAFALSAVFDGWGWLLPVAGAVVVVVAVNELTRWSPLPSSLGPLLAAAGLLAYVTAVYAGATAYLHVIPSHASLDHLDAVARDGFHDVRTLGTPVPTHAGLVLLSAVGVAAIALVVDLFAVTMRRAALAGLPLLALFAVCTSVAKGGAGWLPFVVAAAGYLWLLLADARDRLARWGRPLGYDTATSPRFNWSDSEVMPSPLSVLGRRIGLSAIAIAVVVPLVVPGLRGGVPHGHGGSGFGFGNGSAEAFTVNPIVTIQAELTSSTAKPLLTVQTTDSSPGYLRLTALDRFDGTSFAPSKLQAPSQDSVASSIPAPAIDGPEQTSHISVAGLEVRWLPVPTQVVSVDVGSEWVYDRNAQTIFSARTDTRGLTYDVVSIPPDPSARALQTAEAGVADDGPGVATALQQPPGVSDDVRRLTAEVTRNATTPFAKAVAIQTFLNSSRFHYDLTVQSGDSASALDDFLLHTRRGFCQQFAAAMAVMARLVHIPARVAVGFTRGEQQRDGTWVVTTRDAHAWPELYFRGFGWLPFEPTPRGDGQAVQPDYTVVLPAPGTKPGDGNPNIKKGQGGSHKSALSKNKQFDLRADANGGSAPNAAAPARPTHPVRAILGWLALALAVALLLTPATVRRLGRRRRWRRADTAAAQAAAAWSELRASAIDARVDWLDGLSPRASAALLRADAGGLSTTEWRALDRIVTAVERAWYSPAPARPGALSDLRDDVDLLRSALFSEVTVGERLALKGWPRSTLRDLRIAVGRLAEALDALDVAGARLRARLSARPGAAASAPRAVS